MDEESLRFPDRPRSELERTIGDLIVRAERVLGVQGRLRGLLSANRAIVEDLDLDRVLTRIVEAGMALVGAEYGALGVIDEDRRLERFIHVGIPADHAALIGRLPEGQGLLGAVIDSATTIRLPHLADDPRSVGFPAHHPPMDAFLGVPIRVRDEVYGNLYLTNPAGGAFDEEDEELIESLAATAGIAIENARLYDEARRQQKLSRAFSEVTAALLSPGTGDVLGAVAERVALIVPVELVAIVTPDGDDRVRVDVARGRHAADLRGAVLPADSSLAARAIDTGHVITDDDAERTLLDGRIRLGPVAAVPLIAAGRSIGALCVARAAGGETFTHDELATVSEFAAQAGIAISLAWARRDRQRLDVVEDRSRIARDLHDHVIQRLFGTSLGLQALAAADPAQADRIEEHVAELDAAIVDIRTAIFALRTRSADGTDLTRHRLLDVVTELTPALAAAPRITFTGPVDLTVTGPLADDVVAVVRECLANVARHAHARHTLVAVVVTDADVTVTVDDDGVGIGADAGAASGTANLAERAAARGGGFTLEPGPERGTRARWNAPIEP